MTIEPVANAGCRTSKEELLKALAAQLKREKAKTAEMSSLVETSEQQLNDKHERLTFLEATYEEEHRKNEAILHNLRRDVARAREQLDNALSCGELEAQQYLDLLQGDTLDKKIWSPGPTLTDRTPQNRIQEWKAKRDYGRQQQNRLLETRNERQEPTRGTNPIVQSVTNVLASNRSSPPRPQKGDDAEARTKEKIRQLEERVALSLGTRDTNEQTQPMTHSFTSDYPRLASDSEYGEAGGVGLSVDDEESSISLSRILRPTCALFFKLSTIPNTRPTPFGDETTSHSSPGSTAALLFPAPPRHRPPPLEISSISSYSHPSTREIDFSNPRQQTHSSHSDIDQISPPFDVPIQTESEHKGLTFQLLSPTAASSSLTTATRQASFETAPTHPETVSSPELATGMDAAFHQTAAPTTGTARRARHHSQHGGSEADTASSRQGHPDFAPPTSPASPFELRHAVIGRKEGARMLASDVVKQAQQQQAIRSAQSIQTERTLPPGASHHLAPQLQRDSGPEGSMQELTRRASAEDDLDPAKRESLATGKVAGLGSPFPNASSILAAARRSSDSGPTFIAKSRPPVSGSSLPTLKQRTTSGESLRLATSGFGSVSKDQLLRDLAEAVKSERRRIKLYEEEVLSAEKEIDYITRETTAVENRYVERISHQEQEIAELTEELERLKMELEVAYDLDEDIANELQELLSSRMVQIPGQSPSNGQAVWDSTKKPIIGTFDLEALRGSKSSNKEVSAVQISHEGPNRLRKVSKAKRRIDSHIVAHKSDIDTVPPPPKPSLWSRTRRLSRSLSQSKTLRPSSEVATTTSTTQPELSDSKAVSFGVDDGRDVRPTNMWSSSSESLSSNVPQLGYHQRSPANKDSKKPPVSGHTQRGRSVGTSQPSRTRSRSNSLKRGLASTLRVMFPSNAAAQPAAADRVARKDEKEAVRTWLGDT
ncbi:hypothetical protein OIO90_002545 [Microbotryomycetes sp. JL221]|nr:hypothetical protein OIO90_002545 [Microbotryomycetes sp. JL221]